MYLSDSFLNWFGKDNCLGGIDLDIGLEVLLFEYIVVITCAGYLEEECRPAAEAFLNQSSLLQECAAYTQMGRTFTTKFCGLDLKDVFEVFSEGIAFGNN